MKRLLTCIVCPMGCAMTVELEDGEVRSVVGNTCPRGRRYAIDECTHPMRTVTTAVRCADGRMLPVKTDRPIPKERMMECVALLHRMRVSAPVHVGDVLVGEVLGTEANVVATANLE